MNHPTFHLDHPPTFTKEPSREARQSQPTDAAPPQCIPAIGAGSAPPADPFTAETLAVIHSCHRRAVSWRLPPNWCANDWSREVEEIVTVAAWMGQDEFDSERGVPYAGFLHQRAMNRVLTRYRQEWNYGLRFHSSCSENDTPHEDDAPPPGEIPDHCAPDTAEALPEEAETLVEAIAALPDAQRRLIGLLFFEEKSEREIASEFGISQPAVSQRKHAILRKLRSTLEAARLASAAGSS